MESTGANVSLFSGMRLLPDELLGRSTVRHFPFKSARVIVVNVSVFVKAEKRSSGVYLIYLVESYHQENVLLTRTVIFCQFDCVI